MTGLCPGAILYRVGANDPGTNRQLGRCPEATMTHLPILAAIDHYTGYVWGVSENLPANLSDDTAAEVAGKQILSAADGSREYVVKACGRYDAGASLHLYEIPDTLDITDGQDAAQIAAVECGRYVGSVRVVPPDAD